MGAFAYQKMILAIKSRTEKMGVAVYVVNPTYTSQIGKMKYMKRLGVSIHMAAFDDYFLIIQHLQQPPFD
ncbi:hypothetical protein [Halolactibacillus alkaliphilus]|uniref:hypothetical protein n=1 Tax=Halolactibacillus alkaliphilus TaxID=442899 RepID=UPI001478144F